MADERLTADDNLFLAMEQLMGTPAVPQVIWRLPLGTGGDSAGSAGAVRSALDAVRALGARLSTGRLSRRVRRVPGPARDRWRFTPDAGRTRVSTDPVAAGGERDWADSCLRGSIDSVNGPSWALSAAPTTDGHLLVSLAWSHVVSDGAATIRAVTEAVDATCEPVAVHGGRTSFRDTVRDQVRDSSSLLAEASRALVHLARGARSGGTDSGTADSPPLPGTDDLDDAPAPVPTVAVQVDAEGFGAAAARAGGTPNSLFQAITLGVLAATGRVGDGDVVPMSSPISMRDDPLLHNDLRANATTGATVHATVSPDRYTDLAPLRSAAKKAYGAVTSPAPDAAPNTTASVTQLAQALPDVLVRRAASDATLPLCLASNIGDPGPHFTGLGLGGDPGQDDDGGTAGIAIRMVVPASSPRVLAERRGGVSAWAILCGRSLSLSFVSLDPVRVRDSGHLLGLVTAELDRWELDHDHWL
ncbi:MAG: hypothetical protein ACTH1D_10780 [Mycobacteriaceae bacterium]|uniref:hypothetical protein n=1 Tax=Corynebacterium sp. TaxID=1720 RepID=UPI003F9DBA41